MLFIQVKNMLICNKQKRALLHLNKALFNTILFSEGKNIEINITSFYSSVTGVTIGFPSLSNSGVRPPEYPSS